MGKRGDENGSSRRIENCDRARLEKRCAECEENDELLMKLVSCLCKALETREKLGEDSGRMEIVLRGAPGGEEAR